MKKTIFNLLVGLVQTIIGVFTVSLLSLPLNSPDNYLLFVIFAFSAYLYVITVVKISRM